MGNQRTVGSQKTVGHHRIVGKVYLVGAGPGDEGLLTLKGMECLQIADVVIYDYLVNEQLLRHCPKECERIYVGKKAEDHSLSQDGINQLLVEKARRGLVVVRLKGGDPFIFGRGGEEALELARAGIGFEIVPGVTAATAACAYSGIPLSQRGLSSTIILVTGHEAEGKRSSSIPWEKLAIDSGTLVFYMGIRNLALITAKLQDSGMPADTPAALIRWGTLNRQETLTGTVESISGMAEEKAFRPPAILVIGKVVTLRDEIRWFDIKPLWAKRIIVTRSRDQVSVLAKKLKNLGADVVEFPTIEIEPSSDFTNLDDVIESIDSFNWIVFTSENGVGIFFNRLFTSGFDSRSLKGAKIAVIGKGTGEHLSSYGIKADLVPDRFISEGLVEAFSNLQTDLAGSRILLPCAEASRDVIPSELGKMGAEVVRVPIYRSKKPEYSDEQIDEVFGEGYDLITFTSSSTVLNLVDILKSHDRERYIGKIRGASIGPITSSTASENKISILLEAREHTIEGLVESILNHLEKRDKA